METEKLLELDWKNATNRRYAQNLQGSWFCYKAQYKNAIILATKNGVFIESNNQSIADETFLKIENTTLHDLVEAKVNDEYRRLIGDTNDEIKKVAKELFGANQ